MKTAIENHQVVIRKVTEADCAQLLGMVQGLAVHHDDVAKASLQTLRRDVLGDAPWLRVLIALIGDAPVGYIALCPLAQMQFGVRGMDMHHLFVKAGFRGRGIGGQLIGAAKQKARGLGCDFMMVGTHPDNRAAQAFYLSQGFTLRHQTDPRFRLVL